jgi:aryl-alcohol dehydrogenase-like predicted oxidoreductase
MTFGLDWGWGSDVPESCAIMDEYIDRGGNFIDSANIYTKGHSEKIIGDHLGANPAKRDRLVLATKFMGNMFLRDPNGGGGGRKGIIGACEESLRRMRTPYIDLFWMHFWDPNTPMEETMRALDDLVRSGKVRYIGFSDTPAWKCAQAQMMAGNRGWSPLIAAQIEYSLLERTVEGDLIPMALEMGMGVTPWSPLKGGVLTGKYTRAKQPEPGRGSWVQGHLKERAFAVIDELIAIGKQVGGTPAQVAMNWVQNQPGVAGRGSTIFGARTIEQLRDNLGALSITLDAEHVARLNDLTKPTLPFPHDFLRGTFDNVQGGAMVNGRASTAWNLAPQSDKERW